MCVITLLGWYYSLTTFFPLTTFFHFDYLDQYCYIGYYVCTANGNRQMLRCFFQKHLDKLRTVCDTISSTKERSCVLYLFVLVSKASWCVFNGGECQAMG